MAYEKANVTSFADAVMDGIVETKAGKAARSLERRSLPVLDVGPALTGDKTAIRALAEQWREVWETVGFMCIVNHGVPAETIARSKGHHRDWLDACKGGPAASSHFEYGAKLTELALLGVLSLRTGKKLSWDAAAMKVRGLPEADAFIKEQYRKGWEID